MDQFSISHWLIFGVIAFVIWRALARRKPDSTPGTNSRATAPPAGPKVTRLPTAMCKAVSVAGTDYRTDDLRAAVSTKLQRYRAELDDSIDDSETADIEVNALLQFQDDNPHDKNAVKVLVGNRHVGYIPAGLAPHFRTYVRRQGLPGPVYSCAAEVEVEVKSGDPVAMTLLLPPLKS